MPSFVQGPGDNVVNLLNVVWPPGALPSARLLSSSDHEALPKFGDAYGSFLRTIFLYPLNT